MNKNVSCSSSFLLYNPFINYKKGYDMVLFVKFFSLLKISEAIFYIPRKKEEKK